MRRTQKILVLSIVVTLVTLAEMAHLYRVAQGVEVQWSARHTAPEVPLVDAKILCNTTSPLLPLVVSSLPPRTVSRIAPHSFLIDFGKVAFGTLQISLTSASNEKPFTVLVGEKTIGDRGVWTHERDSQDHFENVAYAEQSVISHGTPLIVPLPKRTLPCKEELPAGISGILPFRYAEIDDAPEDMTENNVLQLMVHYPFEDAAASFHSSSTMLNDVWQFSKYSIKATSFAGIYVDGNRERQPYEDGYIYQLGHYNLDTRYGIARRTISYLLEKPTWPTEWMMLTIFMAYTDFLYTGDRDFLDRIYPMLLAHTLTALARSDGLISTHGTQSDSFLRSIHRTSGAIQDIVDWPPVERADYEKVRVDLPLFFMLSAESFLRDVRATLVRAMGFRQVAQLYQAEADRVRDERYTMPAINTVVNAYHYQALIYMADLAEFSDRPEDAKTFRAEASRVMKAMHEKLFDYKTGLFVDGEGSSHSSFQANVFPMAFGLTPHGFEEQTIQMIRKHGMGSVYCAQYLIEVLYKMREDRLGLALLTSTDKRSWSHMMNDLGSTITTEAWDEEIQPDMDWNHAWGASPANLIPRYVMGIRPTSPGFKTFLVAPQFGDLSSVSATLPTVAGAIQFTATINQERSIYTIQVPLGTTAEVQLPRPQAAHFSVVVDHSEIARTTGEGKALSVGQFGYGQHEIVVQQ